MNGTRGIAAAFVLWILRLGLSGIFIWAGALKIGDPQGFADSVASFRLLPTLLVSPVALTLPPLEILAGVLALLPGRARRAGAFCLLVMLIVFAAAIASAEVRGLKIDCGCFGARGSDLLAPSKSLVVDLARDVALGLAAGFLYGYARAGQSRDAVL